MVSLNPAKWFESAGITGTTGLLAALLIFLGIGIGIFTIGVIFYQKEIKKPKDAQNYNHIIIGYICMVLGMVIGLGFGSPICVALLAQK